MQATATKPRKRSRSTVEADRLLPKLLKKVQELGEAENRVSFVSKGVYRLAFKIIDSWVAAEVVPNYMAACERLGASVKRKRLTVYEWARMGGFLEEHGIPDDSPAPRALIHALSIGNRDYPKAEFLRAVSAAKSGKDCSRALRDLYRSKRAAQLIHKAEGRASALAKNPHITEGTAVRLQLMALDSFIHKLRPDLEELELVVRDKASGKVLYKA